MMASNKRLAFLFGAGVSVPYLGITTQSLTEAILSGDVRKHTDEHYYPDRQSYGNPKNQQWIPKIGNLLKRLKQESDAFYIEKLLRSTNYEDLYYLCDEIRRNDNPMLKPLLDKASPDVAGDLVLDNYGEQEKITINKLARETGDYIHDLVWRWLVRTSVSASLDVIKDAVADADYSSVDIYTLNHDTLLERYLRQENIPFTDGFHTDNSQLFDSGDLENYQTKVRIIKLHGSVDWWETDRGIEKSEEEPDNYEVKRYRAFRPIMLIGTLNKASGYLAPPFIDLFACFYRALPRIDHFVVIGYGFGDEEINRLVSQWLASHVDSRTVFVEPIREKLKHNKFIIEKQWEEIFAQMPAISKGAPRSAAIKTIPKGIESVSWGDVKNELQVR